jgi:hypothetical protein
MNLPFHIPAYWPEPVPTSRVRIYDYDICDQTTEGVPDFAWTIVADMKTDGALIPLPSRSRILPRMASLFHRVGGVSPACRTQLHGVFGATDLVNCTFDPCHRTTEDASAPDSYATQPTRATPSKEDSFGARRQLLKMSAALIVRRVGSL